ncbi:MAG: hypothetical protein LBK63_04590 [Treponema sp.]|nr:hypothetical protein [Treponema sp.]
MKNKIEIFQRIYAGHGIGVINKNVLDIAVTEWLKLQEKGFSIEDDDLFDSGLLHKPYSAACHQ